MNKDFPRIMTLLRKERGLSQKQVAADLAVTQALLSHYEKGKRECGLDFLVRVADYYDVSVDYLLGRTSASSGATVSEQELPESAVSEKYDGAPSGVATFLQKKLITNAVEIIFSLLIKTRNAKLAKAVCGYLSAAVYRAYRMVYSAGHQNDEKAFSIPPEKTAGLVSARLTLDDITAGAASAESEDEKITTTRLEQDYPKQSAALFSIVNTIEKELETLSK